MINIINYPFVVLIYLAQTVVVSKKIRLALFIFVTNSKYPYIPFPIKDQFSDAKIDIMKVFLLK